MNYNIFQIRVAIYIIFFIFLYENICCGYSLEASLEALIMSTHNICFHGEIRKIVVFSGWKRYLTWGYETISMSIHFITCLSYILKAYMNKQCKPRSCRRWGKGACYSKCPKISNTLFYTFLAQILFFMQLHVFSKIPCGIANSLDQDQTAPLEAV